MKSILLNKVSTLGFSFLLIISVGLLYSFSNSEKSNSKTEYLSIIIDYANNIQFVKITEGTTSSKKIAIISPDNRKELVHKRLNKGGFEVIYKKVSDSFDNKYIFEILQQYEAKGWSLKSHNFGVGSSEGGDTRMSFYLFTK